MRMKPSTNTFKAAAISWGLLEDDLEWRKCLDEALNTLTHTFMQAVTEFGYSKTEAPRVISLVTFPKVYIFEYLLIICGVSATVRHP